MDTQQTAAAAHPNISACANGGPAAMDGLRDECRDILDTLAGAREVESKLRAERDTLAAENAELKRDKERLDLLRQVLFFERGMHQSDATDERRTVKSWWHLTCSSEHFVTDSDDPPDSLDAAIDAALAQKPPVQFDVD